MTGDDTSPANDTTHANDTTRSDDDGGGAGAAPGATAGWEALTQLAERLAAEQRFGGQLLATQHGRVLHESCHGMANRADGIPVSTATRFGTGSLSKMFTAVAIVLASREGLFSLQDSVTDLLPESLRPSTLSPDVQVHHLLTHTSGIADYFEEDDELPGYREDYAELWTDLPVYSVRDYTALLPLFADLEPVSAPGEAYHYSNAGYVLLGILLAHVTGEPFADAVASRVLEPAGMTSSGHPAVDEVHPHLATGYLPPSREGGPWRSNIFSMPPVGGGDGGAMVNAADVDIFLRALASGEVWGNEVSALVLERHADLGYPGWSAGYGVEIRPDGAFGKDGGDPGVYSYSRHWAEAGLSVVMLANVDEESVEELEDVLDLLLETAETYL